MSISTRPFHQTAFRLIMLLSALLFGPTPLARAANFTVISTSDDPNDLTSLRAAINGVQASMDASDTITLTTTGTITLANGELALTNPNGIPGKTVTINGPGAQNLTVNGNNATRVFHFVGLNVSASGLTVANGNAIGLGGGGVLQQGGTLALTQCVVSNCAAVLAGALGGGIANDGGALTLNRCVVTASLTNPQNAATAGGGVGSRNGSLTMTGCTVNASHAWGGGGAVATANETAVLTRCTLTNNFADQGGGVYSAGDTLTMTDCAVSNNEAFTAGGGVYVTGGSAILHGCTLDTNQATGGSGAVNRFGGGLANDGATVSLTNCTVVSNNVAFDPPLTRLGGGVYNAGTLALSDSTLARNSPAGLHNAAGGATITATILAANNSGDVTVGGGAVLSGGSNLIGDPSGNGFINDPNHADPASAGNHDQTGVTDPGLGPLQDNGGPTQTVALQAGSPAIDGDFADSTPTDQRGGSRPQGARNDIGAFEFGATAPPAADVYVVTNTNDSGAGSLRDAIAAANTDPGSVVTFDPTVFGPGMPRTITLTTGPLVITQSFTIAGPGRDLLAVSGNNASRVFVIQSFVPTLQGLTITGGNAGTGDGGGLLGGANLTDCAIVGNTAPAGDGGGLYLTSGSLTRCLVRGNTAPNGRGGGLDIDDLKNGATGTTSVGLTDCTIFGNSAASGGGLANGESVTTLTGCTLTGNSATSGGGVYNYGVFTGLLNCTIMGNAATIGGGVCAQTGGVYLQSDTISGNTGGGLYDGTASFSGPATATVLSTIIAGNTGGNVVNNGGTAASNGSNLIGDPDDNGFVNGVNHDQTGVTNPGLGPLRDNGGLTPTLALLVGSPAIDADYNAQVGLTTDQRGAPRPVGARSDIGAYEFGAVVAQQDIYAVTENTPLTVPAPGVLANDTSDGAPLTVSVQTPPVHGQLTLNPDGSFTYTPDTGFLGADAFTYLAQNGSGLGGTATVTLTVSNAAPPTTTPHLAGPPYFNGFWRGPVTVTLTATNGGSGVSGTFFRVDSGPQQTYTRPFTVSGDFTHLVTFYSISRDGVAEAPNGSVTFSIDATPPVTEITSQDDPRGRLITLADRDNFSGPSGTFYRIDSGPEQAYAGPFVVLGNYDHLVTAYSIDRAGNAENPNKSLAFTLSAPALPSDTTPPVTVVSTTGPSYANGFWRGPVTVTLTATDNASGIAGTFFRVDSGPQQTYSGPFVVSGDFAHLVTFYSVDGAGNAESPNGSATFSIDTTPPVTEITSRAVPGGREVTLATRDNFAGPGGAFYRVDSGPEHPYTGPFVVRGAFTHLVTAYSLDRAQNAEQTAKSLTFTVGPTTTRPRSADTIPPVTTAAVTGPPGSKSVGFHRAATVTLSATNAGGSGVAGTFFYIDGSPQQLYAGPFTVTGAGPHTVTFFSTDNDGNAEAPPKSVSFTIIP